MNVFVATISYGEYEDVVVYSKIFSSLESYKSWKDSYITDKDILDWYGKEYCVLKEIELDTNRVIRMFEGEYLRAF